MATTEHLSALQLRLSHELSRLEAAKTEGACAWGVPMIDGKFLEHHEP